MMLEDAMRARYFNINEKKTNGFDIFLKEVKRDENS